MLDYLILEFCFKPLTRAHADALEIGYVPNSVFTFTDDYLVVFFGNTNKFLLEDISTGDADFIPLREFDLTLVCDGVEVF